MKPSQPAAKALFEAPSTPFGEVADTSPTPGPDDERRQILRSHTKQASHTRVDLKPLQLGHLRKRSSGEKHSPVIKSPAVANAVARLRASGGSGCCGCGVCRTLLICAVVVGLLVAEGFGFIYLWPSPLQLTGQRLLITGVAMTQQSPPQFTASGTVRVSFTNPTGLPQTISGARISIFHPDGLGRTSIAVATLSSPDASAKGRSSLDLKFPLALDSSNLKSSYLSSCASLLATGLPCRLLLRLSAPASVLGLSHASLQVRSEWYADVFLSDADVAGSELFGG